MSRSRHVGSFRLRLADWQILEMPFSWVCEMHSGVFARCRRPVNKGFGGRRWRRGEQEAIVYYVDGEDRWQIIIIIIDTIILILLLLCCWSPLGQNHTVAYLIVGVLLFIFFNINLIILKITPLQQGYLLLLIDHYFKLLFEKI